MDLAERVGFLGLFQHEALVCYFLGIANTATFIGQWGLSLKLTDKEREVLRAVELQAALPITKLRKTLGYRDHTIRRIIDRLQERRIIGSVRPYTNFYKLGFSEFAVYLSLAAEDPAKKKAVLDYLESKQNIAFIAEIGGEYQYMITMYETHSMYVSRELEMLCDQFPNVLTRKTFSLRNSVCLFGRKYLSRKDHDICPLEARASKELVTLDELDKKILKLLSYENYSSISELADRSGIPVTTFKRRKKTLEEMGVISGYYVKLETENFGIQQYRLLVSTKGKSSELKRKIYSVARTHRNISFLVDCIGSWDFEIGVEVAGSDDLLEITSSLYSTYPEEIVSIQVIPQFRYRKYSAYPFTKDADDELSEVGQIVNL